MEGGDISLLGNRGDLNLSSYSDVDFLDLMKFPWQGEDELDN